MKRIGCILRFVVLIMFILASYAYADSRDEKLAKHIKLSGIENALTSLPEQLEALSSQRLITSENPKEVKKVTDILKKAFDSERARKGLFQFLSMEMNDSLLQNLLIWYESPLGQKIVSEERSSSGADKQANILRYLASLQETPQPWIELLLFRMLNPQHNYLSLRQM